MPETKNTMTGVAAKTEAATPYVFLNRKLAPCRYCEEIHDYHTRGCVPVVAYSGTREYDAGASIGEPQKLDELPHRWRPFKSPDTRFRDSSTDDEPPMTREVFDPVYGRNGLPL